MAKAGSERQMQYEARQKERDKAYLKKKAGAEGKTTSSFEKDKVRYEGLKAKNRERKRQSHNPSDNPPILNSSYTNR